MCGSSTVAYRTSAISADRRSGQLSRPGTASIGLRASVFPPIGIQGRVLCLTVNGNRAVIGIDGSIFNTLPPPGAQGALIEVIDGGAQNDTQGFTPLLSPPTACPLTFTTPQDQVLSGDLVVTDSQPPAGLPTSKDQCKDGGWQNVKRADGSGFKNQGDCIQYVNTGK